MSREQSSRSMMINEVELEKKVKEFMQKAPEDQKRYERNLLRLAKNTSKTDDLSFLLSVLISNGNDVLFAKTELETQKPYNYVELMYIEAA
jgi:hypothetical protein